MIFPDETERTDTYTSKKEEPKLGLATTRELLNEIAVRIEIDIQIKESSLASRYLREVCMLAMNELEERTLNYRTVDSS
jgi:hypothetical protein